MTSTAENPNVLGVGFLSSAFNQWLDNLLLTGKFQIQNCPGVDELLLRLRESVVDLVILAEGNFLPLNVLALTQLIHEAVLDVPIVMASEQNAPPTPPNLMNEGILWTFSLFWPMAEVIPALQYLIHKHQRLRQADAAEKLFTSRLHAEAKRMATLQCGVRELIHELNTPITIIQGYCCNLLDGIVGPLGTEQRANIDRIYVTCQLMMDIVGRIKKEIPRSEKPSQPLQATRINQRRQIRLPELIKEVASLLEPPFVAKGVRLRLDLCTECHPVWAERLRIAQLLINLLTNALRYTPPGGEVVAQIQPELSEVGTENMSLREAYRITVRDNGSGIPLEHQDKIFNAGWSYSLESTEARSGLGLAICKEIAKEHSARLWVESIPGNGASFHLVLPADPRTRSRQFNIRCVEDITLAGQLLLELRKRNEGPLQFLSEDDMEVLADQIQGQGLPLILLGSVAQELHHVMNRVER